MLLNIRRVSYGFWWATRYRAVEIALWYSDGIYIDKCTIGMFEFRSRICCGISLQKLSLNLNVMDRLEFLKLDPI